MFSGLHHFLRIEMNYKQRGKRCGYCGTSYVGNMSRHIATHTGLAVAQVHNSKATRIKSTAGRNRKLDQQPRGSPGFDVDLAREMIQSFPAKCRHRGGRFEKGPLAGENIRGMPKVFNQDGCVKDHLRWLKQDLSPQTSSHPARRNHGGQFQKGPLAGENIRGMPEVFNQDGRVKDHLRWLKQDLSPQTSSRPARRTRYPRQCRIENATRFLNEKWIEHTEQSFIEIEANIYTPSKFPNWKKPRGWTMEWPENPTATAPDESCSLCSAQYCKCLTEYVHRDVPSVVPAGAMGEGVQATVEYQVGDLIGELVGELVPLEEKVENGWVAEMARGDLGGRSYIPVCRVNCQFAGNWVRKINHSCDPNVRFICQPISGMWRIMVEAVKCIKAGNAITVHYGDEFWEQSGNKCLCGSEGCISGPAA